MKPSWLDFATSGINGLSLYWLAQIVSGGLRYGCKVIVNRRAKWQPWPSTLYVEYFADLDEAESRQRELLKNWTWKEWEGAPVLTAEELKTGWREWKRTRRDGSREP
ncbi:MAG: hypothetical protein QM655_13110, partial [Nocardioidaceae bacterium]